MEPQRSLDATDAYTTDTPRVRSLEGDDRLERDHWSSLRAGAGLTPPNATIPHYEPGAPHSERGNSELVACASIFLEFVWCYDVPNWVSQDGIKGQLRSPVSLRASVV
jgi:hypothetical protein